MAENKQDAGQGRKKYSPPEIVHTEKLTARAAVCVKADSTTCAQGPIQS